MLIQKYLNLKAAVLLALLLLVFLILPTRALAATNTSTNSTALTTTSGCAIDGKDNAAGQKCLESNPIINDLNVIVKFLSAVVGVVVVGDIMLGGIQYMAAGDKAESITKAKGRIVNGMIALVAFLFTFAFLQWIIPGGIFNS